MAVAVGMGKGSKQCLALSSKRFQPADHGLNTEVAMWGLGSLALSVDCSSSERLIVVLAS